MLSGHVDHFSRHGLMGWAADNDRPDARLQLCVMVNGAEQGRVVADRPREGLRQRGIYGDGAHAFEYVFDPPLSPLRGYDVVVRFADAPASLGQGRFHIPPEPKENLSLSPLLVTATGRSGTTLLMRRLGNSRDIIITERYPFEMKLLTYYASALEVLTTASSRKHPPSLDELTQDPFHLPRNPFHHQQMESIYPDPAMLYRFFGHRSAARLQVAFRDIVDDFYFEMAMHQKKSAAKFFAEKCDVFTPARSFAKLAFDGVKEILLVRDPRDIHCSRQAFWSDTTESSFQNLLTVQAFILPILERNASDLLIVRYEDLVQQAKETIERVSNYLGLGPIALDLAAEQQIFVGHGTSRDPAASIGRWKVELNTEEQAAFIRQFRPLFDAFGYETGAA